MRILLVDDSALARGILKQALEEAGFEIVGQASNGQQGVDLNKELKPDLIIMDLNMPILDGLGATREIMKEAPAPIFIFSTEVEAKTGFEAVSAGALDVMRKPGIWEFNDPDWMHLFKEKISKLMKKAPAKLASALPENRSGIRNQGFQVLLIGASTGGPLAIREVLTALPKDFPLGIAVVQHLEAGFDQGYADWLQESCALKVSLAKDQEILEPGLVKIAPVGRHLVFQGKHLVLDNGPEVLNQKPAVDVLFKSAAKNFGAACLGVLLTGMGRDGAEGCKVLKDKGAYTLVQDQASSAVYGMPKEAADLGGACEILDLKAIGPRLVELCKN